MGFIIKGLTPVRQGWKAVVSYRGQVGTSLPKYVRGNQITNLYLLGSMPIETLIQASQGCYEHNAMFLELDAYKEVRSMRICTCIGVCVCACVCVRLCLDVCIYCLHVCTHAHVQERLAAAGLPCSVIFIPIHPNPQKPKP